MGEVKTSSVGSGWVSLPSGSHAHKSFVGSVNREPSEMMDTSDEPGSVTSNVYEEKKEERSYVLSKSAIKRMQSLLSGTKIYSIRLSGALNSVSFSSGAASALMSWSPISIGEFVDFAVLFTEYRVRSHNAYVWFPNQAGATLGGGAGVALIGSDPGSRISTPGALDVGDLGDSKRWNPSQTNNHALCFTSGDRLVSAGVQATPLTRDGWQLTSDAWGGQTVLTTSAPTSSSALAFQYQQEWWIDFRCRV
jgi:hypothetical protein